MSNEHESIDKETHISRSCTTCIHYRVCWMLKYLRVDMRVGQFINVEVLFASICKKFLEGDEN